LLPYHPWTWAAWAAWMLCSRSWTLKWWPHMHRCPSPTGPGKISPPVTLVSAVAALLTLFCVVSMCLSSPKHLPDVKRRLHRPHAFLNLKSSCRKHVLEDGNRLFGMEKSACSLHCLSCLLYWLPWLRYYMWHLLYNIACFLYPTLSS